MSIGGIFLYKSYAYYENEKEYNVIKGIIPDFSYDVKFAIEVDGEKKDTIPKSSETKNNNYYRVEATCDNNEKAEWDYNSWSIKVSNLQDGTKCKLAFTSDLSKEELDEYIEAGVAYRRNTYRGKDITSKLTDKSLFSEIKSGHFDDIYVGDYIKTNNNNHSVTWLIADLDNYYQTGIPNYLVKEHHATIIPAVPLMSAKMNSTATTANGYAGSEMVKTTLPSILSTYITPVFGSDNIIEYGSFLTNNVDTDAGNRMGSSSQKGASSSWQLVSRKLDLMSEINVYGTSVWSSSGADVGIDKAQYALFRLKPKLTHSYEGQGFSAWFKDVASSTKYALIDGYGYGSTSDANKSFGVRPRFLIR